MTTALVRYHDHWELSFYSLPRFAARRWRAKPHSRFWGTTAIPETDDTILLLDGTRAVITTVLAYLEECQPERSSHC